ncbi:MAG: hypothetical protein V1929_01020 [bacterium]
MSGALPVRGVSWSAEKYPTMIKAGASRVVVWSKAGDSWHAQ